MTTKTSVDLIDQRAKIYPIEAMILSPLSGEQPAEFPQVIRSLESGRPHGAFLEKPPKPNQESLLLQSF